MHGRNMKFLSLSIIGNYCSDELSPAARQPHSRARIFDKRRKPACALSSCLAAAITAKFMRKEQKLSPGHGTWLHQAPAETINRRQSERTEQETGRASFLTSLSRRNRGSLTVVHSYAESSPQPGLRKSLLTIRPTGRLSRISISRTPPS